MEFLTRGTRLAGFNQQNKNLLDGNFGTLETYIALGIQRLGIVLENKVCLDSKLTIVAS